jgi:hypothetical protein
MSAGPCLKAYLLKSQCFISMVQMVRPSMQAIDVVKREVRHLGPSLRDTLSQKIIARLYHNFVSCLRSQVPPCPLLIDEKNGDDDDLFHIRAKWSNHLGDAGTNVKCDIGSTSRRSSGGLCIQLLQHTASARKARTQGHCLVPNGEP